MAEVAPAAYPDAKGKAVSPAPATAGPAGDPTEAEVAADSPAPDRDREPGF